MVDDYIYFNHVSRHRLYTILYFPRLFILCILTIALPAPSRSLRANVIAGEDYPLACHDWPTRGAPCRARAMPLPYAAARSRSACGDRSRYRNIFTCFQPMSCCAASHGLMSVQTDVFQVVSRIRRIRNDSFVCAFAPNSAPVSLFRRSHPRCSRSARARSCALS